VGNIFEKCGFFSDRFFQEEKTGDFAPQMTATTGGIVGL